MALGFAGRTALLLSAAGAIGLSTPALSGAENVGVSVVSRSGAAGQISLLVEARGAAGKAADEVTIGLPSKTAGRFSAAYLPAGWSAGLEKSSLRLAGSAISMPLRLRLDAPGAEAPTRVSVRVRLSGATLFENDVNVGRAPPVKVASSLEGLLALPKTLYAGDRVACETLDAARTPAGGQWTVAGASVQETANSGRPGSTLRFRLPDNLRRGDAIAVSYSDPWGERAVEAASAAQCGGSAPHQPSDRPRIEACAPKALTGQSVCVCGWFPTDAARDGLTLNGKPLGAPLSASSGVVVERVGAETPPGPAKIGGLESAGFGPADQANVTVIQVGGEIDRNKLMRGETTPMRLWVDGTREPLKLHVTNDTPEVIRLEGGNDQMAATDGKTPNGLTRTVYAVHPGEFKISYSLEEALCPCSEDIVLKGDVTPGVPPTEVRPTATPTPTLIPVTYPTFPPELRTREKSPSPTVTPVPTTTPTPTPTPTYHEIPRTRERDTPTPSPTRTFTPTRTPPPPTATRTPTRTVTSTRTATSTGTPTDTPTDTPTVTPTVTRTITPPTHKTDEKLLCCGMTGDLITYPITSDPMKPPPELEAPRDPAIGGVQVYLHDGAFFTHQTDMSVLALFYDINWGRFWRGDAKFEAGGLLGHGWDFAFNKRIVPIASVRLPIGLFVERAGVETPKLMYYNGTGRAEPYLGTHSESRQVLNFDKRFSAYVTTYKSPPGQFHEIERYVLLGPPSDHPFREHPNVEPTEQIFYVLREKDGTRFVFDCRGQLIYILSRNDSVSQRIRIELDYDEKKFNPLTQNPMLATIKDAMGRTYAIDTTNIGRGTLLTNVRCKVKSGEAPIPRIKSVKGAGISISYDYRNTDTQPFLEATTITARHALERRWEYTYNGSNLITDIKTPNESARGGNPYLHIDYAGQRVKTQWLGEPGAAARQRISFDYQEAIVQETDAAGNRRDYQLEPVGGFHVVRALTVIDADAVANGGPWTTGVQHNEATQIKEIAYPKGNGVTFVYDGTNNEVTKGPVRDWVGHYTYEHNLALGNLESITNHGPTGTHTLVRGDVDATTSTTVNEYDDLYNQIVESRDPLGNSTRFSITDYDTPKHRGCPLEIQFPPVRQPDGTSLKRPPQKITYNAFAQRQQLDEGDGHVTTYEYHTQTRYLRAVSYPGKATETLEQYDSLGHVGERTTQDGKVKYEHDGFGQVTERTVDPDGYKLSTVYQYDRNGNTTDVRTEVKDTFGLKGRAFSGDDSGVDPGRLGLERVLPYWQVLHTDYDILDRQEKTVLSGDGLSTATSYTYSPMGALDHTIGPALDGKTPLRTTYRYDARHLVRKTVETGEGAAGPGKNASSNQASHTEERQYDANGNVELVKTGFGADLAPTSMHYNVLDRGDLVLDPLKAEQRFAYDAAGNVLDLTVTGVGVVLHHTTNEYDAYHHIIRRRRDVLTNSSKEDSRWSYSPRLNLQSTVSPNGSLTKYDYDEQDRVWHLDDALKDRIENHYDPQGNLDSITVTGTAREFDPTTGKLTVSEKQVVDSTATQYDRIGRVIKVTTPARVERRFLDSLGHARGTVFMSGRLTSFKYDGLGRLTEMKTALSRSTKKYTPGGLIDQTDGPEGTFKFTYDPVGRLRKREDLRTGNSTDFEYYNGRITDVTDRHGTIVRTVSNAADLPVDVSVTASGGLRGTIDKFPEKPATFDFLQGARHETFQYDELGRVRRATSGPAPTFSEVIRKYDGLDRITQEEQGQGRGRQAIQYRYDESFRWADVVYPEIASRARLRVQHDPLGRVEGVTVNNAEIASYRYTGIDGFALRRLPNGVETRFSYDERHRLSEVAIAGSSAEVSSDPKAKLLWKGIERYDTGSGARNFMTELQPGDYDSPEFYQRSDFAPDAFERAAASVTTRRTRKKGTDALVESSGTFNVYGSDGHLAKRVDYAGLGQGTVHTVRVDTFTYDAKTHRTSQVETNGGFDSKLPVGFDVSATAQRAEENADALEALVPKASRSAAGTQKFEYDENGSLIKDGRYLYAYDFKNRLTKAQDLWSPYGYNESVTFSYDAFDRRIAIESGRNENEYTGFKDAYWTKIPKWLIYEGTRVIAEAEGGNVLLARFFYGARPGELVRMDRRPEESRDRNASGTIPRNRPLGSNLLTFYAHEDLDGAIRFVTDERGSWIPIQNEFSLGEAKKGQEQAPGDRYVIEGTQVRMPYVAENTRIDGFAGMMYREDSKQRIIDYRSAPDYIAEVERQSTREARLALQDEYSVLILAVPMIVTSELMVVEGMIAPEVLDVLEIFGTGIYSVEHGNSDAWDVVRDLLEYSVKSAALRIGGRLMGRLALRAWVGKVAENVIMDTALGVAWDVGVDGAHLTDALMPNLIRSVIASATASRAIGWAGESVTSALIGAVTNAVEDLPTLPAAVKEETSSVTDGVSENGNCFAAGTLVLTETGERPIEDVRVGDRVWSRDPETEQEGFQAVTRVFTSQSPEFLHVTFRPQLGAAENDAPTIVGTPGHPVWSETSRRWVLFGELEPGEVLSLQDGGGGEVVDSQVQIAPEGRPFATYNLEVERWHTYFVGVAGHRQFVWVHNASRRRLPTSVFRRPHDFNPSTWEVLRERDPWAFDKDSYILKDAQGRYLYDARHIFLDKEYAHFLREMLFERGSPSRQRATLAFMLGVPAASIKSIPKAARAVYLDWYHDPAHLWMGPAMGPGGNRSRGGKTSGMKFGVVNLLDLDSVVWDHRNYPHFHFLYDKHEPTPPPFDPSPW